MYIDFHTHAFADKIAERAIETLTENAKGVDFSPKTNGTLNALKDKLLECGIKKCVVLNIATKPSQQTIVNNWAKEICSDSVYAFGSVHPDADDAIDELVRIKSMGLYGVKLHPDYQNFFADEERMFPIYRKCAELDLPITFHAGWDPLSPDAIHASPEALAKIADTVPNLTIICAHLGGMYRWDDVEKYLVGRRNVYLDTAIVGEHIANEQCERIIKNHGADRILFGTDLPWDYPQNEIDMINRLNLTQNEKELIFHKNAERILDI